MILLAGPVLFAQDTTVGYFDLRDHDFASSPKIALDGPWQYYASQFIDPDERKDSLAFIPIDVPQRLDQSGLEAQGYGTYRLLIIKTTQEPLALHIPDLFSAYQLYVNGLPLANMGQPGVDKDAEKPGRQSKLVPIGHLRQDTLEVIIHISNFVHRKSGIGTSLHIGTYESLIDDKFFQDAYDFFLTGSLVVGAFFFLGLYFFGRHEKMALYFALFCLSYAYRVVGWGNYVLNDLIDIPYDISIRVEFATLYLLVIFGVQYLKHLYPKETPDLFVKIFSTISLLWTASVFLPLRVFSHFNLPYVFVLLATMLGIFIIFIRAIINKRLGAGYSVYSILGITLVFAVKALAYLGIVQEVLWVSMLGQLIFFLFQSLILSKHFTAAWRNAKEAAESAAKVKTDFLSVMSHEIRTPLNTVIGTTYHLLDEKPRKDQEDELNNLKNASEYLLTLINNVLDYSKIDAGKLEFEDSDTELRKYCQDIFNIFSPIAEKKGIEAYFQYDDSIPQVVRLDRTRVNQILTNLIGNAIKFTEKGKIEFIVSNMGGDENNVNVEFKVKDTGIGVSSDLKEHIFKSFQQANTSITREYGGTGLGLSITKQLVELMNATIHLDSEPGKGSTFYFTLKLPVSSEAELTTTKKKNVDLTGYRVLLVEDNQMNILIAKRLLEKWGLSVEVAINGKQAVEKAEQGNFDIILMDLQMPQMDGYEATRILRRKGFKLPIMALTASAMFEKSSKLNEAGLDGLVTKPFNPDDLFHAIAERLAPEK